MSHLSTAPPAGNLWYRQGVTPSYPQGSSWELISSNVTKVSVGPLDQVSVETQEIIILSNSLIIFAFL